MKNLLKWEMKQTLKSKAFWGIGLALILGTVLFLSIAITEGKYSGLELFLHSCSDFNSLILLFIGIYAGIIITGAFEERRVQASVMAGNSRFNIIISKLLSFALSIFVYCICTLSICILIISLTKGFGSDINIFKDIIVRTLAYSFVEVSFASICFFLSMLAKNLGAAITINLIALLALNSLTQSIIGKECALSFMKLTPAGQTFLLVADGSTKNILISIVASLLGLLVVIILSYVKFRKEELK